MPLIKLSAGMKQSRVEFKMNSKQWSESNKVNLNSSLIVLNKKLIITIIYWEFTMKQALFSALPSLCHLIFMLCHRAYFNYYFKVNVPRVKQILRDASMLQIQI